MFDRLRQRLFAKRSLRGLTQPAYVRVEGTVVGDAFESPMTPRRGVLIEYRFYDRLERSSSQENRYYQNRLVTSGRIGEELLVEVEGQLVMIPIDPRMTLRFAAPWDPTVLLSLVPDDLAARHPELAQVREELCYDDKSLSAGARVRIEGTISPVDGGASPYRDGPRSRFRFEALPDRSDLLVSEIA